MKKLMKTLITITIFFALMSCAVAADLSDYPEMFLDDNFNAKVVVGDNAPAEHVIAAVDLLTDLQYYFSNKGNFKDTIQEGEIKTYIFFEKEYTVECIIVSDSHDSKETMLMINGLTTSSLKEGDIETLGNNIQIEIKSIPDNEANVNAEIVEFSMTKLIDLNVPAAKLESEIGYPYSEQNLIIIGTAESNSMFKQFLNSYPKLEENEAYIELIENNGYKQLLIIGGSDDILKIAVNALSNMFENYTSNKAYIQKQENGQMIVYQKEESDIEKVFSHMLMINGKLAKGKNIILNKNSDKNKYKLYFNTNYDIDKISYKLMSKIYGTVLEAWTININDEGPIPMIVGDIELLSDEDQYILKLEFEGEKNQDLTYNIKVEDKVELMFFKRSKCPYSIQLEPELGKIYEDFEEYITYSPIFMQNLSQSSNESFADYYAMHGKLEVLTNALQAFFYTVGDTGDYFEIMEDKDFKCLMDANTYSEFDQCLDELGDEKEALIKFSLDCVDDYSTDTEIKQCFAENIEQEFGDFITEKEIDLWNNMIMDIKKIITHKFNYDIDMMEIYDVAKSPTLLINGEEYTGAKTYSAVKKAVCDAIKGDKPSICEHNEEESKVNFKILIPEIYPSNVVEPGKIILQKFLIEHDSDKTQKNIKVKVSVPELGISASEYIDEIEDKAWSENIGLNIPDTTEEGRYRLKVEIIGDDGFTKNSMQFTLYVTNDKDKLFRELCIIAV